MTIGYIVSGWLLAQVADLVLENIGSPPWVMQTILLLLALGFPVVVFFSWAYEATPEGIKREADVDRSQSITAQTGHKLDRAIMVVLVIAVAYFAFDKFVISADRAAVTADATAPSELIPDDATSIAVLPFVNMSDDKSNEYFSEGLSEELLNLLAKRPELQVAARTSSFSFKGQNLEISDIAQRLHVTHVLEGSVRKSGDQVRITAQLIKADDGYHLWSETYDRKLDNVFAVQDEIASKITAALLPQIISSDDTAPAARAITYTPPADAYQDYLLARNHFNRRTHSERVKAIELLTPLVRENPDYAEAQALYAHSMYLSSARTEGDIPWILAEAQTKKAVQKALSLKPDLAEAYLVEGLLAEQARDPASAVLSFEKAIAANPSFSDAYVSLAEAAMFTGDFDRGWQAFERARALDPVSPNLLRTVAMLATRLERDDMADDAMAALRQIEPQGASDVQIELYRIQGEYARAAIQLEHHLRNYPESGYSIELLGYLLLLFGQADETTDLSPRMRTYFLAQTGRREETLEIMNDVAATRTDPHDRADVYWIAYYFLGMHDEALEVLSDLWYGYAEEELGPRMSESDCIIFASLLVEAGRSDEAQPVIQQIRDRDTNSLTQWDFARSEAYLLLIDGKLDESFELLDTWADQGHFNTWFGVPYARFLGLEKHPDFPALAAKAEAGLKVQRDLYESLKAAE